VSTTGDTWNRPQACRSRLAAIVDFPPPLVEQLQADGTTLDPNSTGYTGLNLPAPAATRMSARDP
jgi:hypothetical protein